jgi:formate hydrogenlyase subunit 6/NADH:ubiquinone oxidoreductase subunit I
VDNFERDLLNMIKEIISLLLSRKDVTEMYPKEVSKPLLPKRTKGFVSVDTYKCTLCGVCSRCCPSQSIKLDKNNLAIKVNYARCMSCGHCVKACPEFAMVFSKEFEGAANQENVFIYSFHIINIIKIKKEQL